MRILLFLFLFGCSVSSVCQDTANVRTFGGPYDDYGNELIETTDGGYAIIGTTGSYFQDNSLIYMIKLNSNLEKEWTKVYGGSNIEWGKSLIETAEGYMLLGFTNSYGAGGYDIYLIRCDFEGEVISEHTYGGSDWDFGSKIIPFGDNYMIVGETYNNSNGGSDAFLVQIDSNGNELWSGNLGGLEDDYLVGGFANGSEVIAIGTTNSFSEKSKVYLLKIDENLQITEMTFGEDEFWHEGNNGILHSNGDIYITGSRESGEFSNYLLMRLNSDFEIVPVSGNPLGGALAENGYDLVETSNGQLVLIGASDSFTGSTGAMVLRATETGSWQASPTFGGGDIDVGRNIILNSSNQIVFVGETNSYGAGNYDVYFVKFPDDVIVQNYVLDIAECFDVLLTDVEEETQTYIPQSTLFPNPASDFVSIKTSSDQNQIVIFNVSGQIVVKSNHNQNQFNLSLSGLSAGVYLVQITSTSKTEYLRLIIE